MRFVPLALTTLAITFAAPSAKADDPIECTDQQRSLPAGNHTGRFVSSRVKLDWNQNYVHFLFQDDNDHQLYCVKQTTDGNANIVALAEEATLLNRKVNIITANGYWMTAISFGATE